MRYLNRQHVITIDIGLQKRYTSELDLELLEFKKNAPTRTELPHSLHITQGCIQYYENIVHGEFGDCQNHILAASKFHIDPNKIRLPCPINSHKSV